MPLLCKLSVYRHQRTINIIIPLNWHCLWGLRSGEIRGLEWKDIDFQNKIIHVRGTLVQNKYGFYKDSPKTQSSYRDIPMLNNVYTLLKVRKKELAEHKMLFASEWKPHEGLENLVVTLQIPYVL